MNWLTPFKTRHFKLSAPGLFLIVAILVGNLLFSTPAWAYRYTFAVIGNTFQGTASNTPTQRLLEAIQQQARARFIVYGGNIKSASETCRDELYITRQQVLNTSSVPLIFVPGQNDWIACSQTHFDAAERLDFIRQTLFSNPSSMGKHPIELTQESEITRFRPYRENVRWQLDDTLFIGLNVPGANNHYLSAGGRNGEFEDRVIATAFWLEHAAKYAKRNKKKALVIFLQGSPNLQMHSRHKQFSWLHMEAPDGYLEFKRSLIKLTQTFRGPVLLVHFGEVNLPGGFLIDQPLRNSKGTRIANLTRLAIALHNPATQWVQINADFNKQPPFSVSIKTVPRNLPDLPTLPSAPIEPIEPIAPQEDGGDINMRSRPMLNAPASEIKLPMSDLPPLLPTDPKEEHDDAGSSASSFVTSPHN